MKKLYTHRSIYLLFAVCWVCYFCTYLGRLNFTACIAEINTAEHISKLKLGQISSAFFVCYGFGQLFSGFLADRLCAKRLTWLRYTQLGDGTVPYAGHDGAHLGT